MSGFETYSLVRFEDKHWRRARKKPLEVNFRDPLGIEFIHTPEGIMRADYNTHVIVQGVDGEEYPVKRSVFAKTYDVIAEEAPR